MKPFCDTLNKKESRLYCITSWRTCFFSSRPLRWDVWNTRVCKSTERHYVIKFIDISPSSSESLQTMLERTTPFTVSKWTGWKKSKKRPCWMIYRRVPVDLLVNNICTGYATRELLCNVVAVTAVYICSRPTKDRRISSDSSLQATLESVDVMIVILRCLYIDEKCEDCEAVRRFFKESIARTKSSPLQIVAIFNVMKGYGIILIRTRSASWKTCSYTIHRCLELVCSWLFGLVILQYSATVRPTSKWFRDTGTYNDTFCRRNIWSLKASKNPLFGISAPAETAA